MGGCGCRPLQQRKAGVQWSFSLEGYHTPYTTGRLARERPEKGPRMWQWESPHGLDPGGRFWNLEVARVQSGKGMWQVKVLRQQMWRPVGTAAADRPEMTAGPGQQAEGHLNLRTTRGQDPEGPDGGRSAGQVRPKCPGALWGEEMVSEN